VLVRSVDALLAKVILTHLAIVKLVIAFFADARWTVLSRAAVDVEKVTSRVYIGFFLAKRAAQQFAGTQQAEQPSTRRIVLVRAIPCRTGVAVH
jgi:hypothetical protein